MKTFNTVVGRVYSFRNSLTTQRATSGNGQSKPGIAKTMPRELVLSNGVLQWYNKS